MVAERNFRCRTSSRHTIIRLRRRACLPVHGFRPSSSRGPQLRTVSNLAFLPSTLTIFFRSNDHTERRRYRPWLDDLSHRVRLRFPAQNDAKPPQNSNLYLCISRYHPMRPIAHARSDTAKIATDCSHHASALCSTESATTILRMTGTS